MTLLSHSIEQAMSDQPQSVFMGLQHGHIRFTPLERFTDLVEDGLQRPKSQSWMSLLPLAKIMGRPGLRGL